MSFREYFKEIEEELKKAKSGHGEESLFSHCIRVRELFDQLFDFHKLNEEPNAKLLRDLGHFLSYYHDLGKLEGWSPGITHSDRSIYRLYRDNVRFNDLRFTALAYFLILRHHSSLRPLEIDLIERYDYKCLVREFRRIEWSELLPRLEVECMIDRVDIVDVFGLFKLADCISAWEAESKKRYAPIKLSITQDSVRNILQWGSRGSFDPERWAIQTELTRLGRLAFLRAPTGWGKTYTSLLYPSSRDFTRVFYLLPTSTAIKKFHQSRCKVFGDDNVSMYFYLYPAHKVLYEEGEDFIEELFFARHFMKPVMITTIDQFLLAFLQLRKYFTRRVAFRGSSIILDEVHILNPMMLWLTSQFLKCFLDKYKLSVLMMSATLPKAYIDFVNEILEEICSLKHGLDLRKEYTKLRRYLYILDHKDIGEVIDEIFRAYFEGKKRVLVIVNTVSKAISIAKALRQMIKEANGDPADVLLIHSRYMYKDRARVEDLIDVYSSRPHILVSTQVCEVSLDISYDLLFTEVAPIGDLIQRFGRVNRYNKWVKEPNVFIFRPSEIADSRRGDRYPYDFEELRTSMRFLEELEEGQLVNELVMLEKIDEVLSVEDIRQSLKGFNFDAWEEVTEYFFSLKLDEKELQTLLQYRESFNVFAVPHPDHVIDEETKMRLEEAIRLLEMRDLSYSERMKAIGNLQSFCVPIPVWYIDRRQEGSEKYVSRLRGDVVYDPEYGLRERSL